CQLRTAPSAMRTHMNGNRAFIDMMSRVQGARYTKEQMPSASLKALLSPKEMEDLRTAVAGSSTIFVPIEFDVDSDKNRARGHVLYRVFDLSSGRLLLQNRFEAQATRGGLDGENQVTVDLLIKVQDDVTARLVAS